MAKNPKKNTIKIGDLANSSNLSVRTLRHYEELGIITPARTGGGTRTYTDKDISLAKFVQKMRDLDISVGTIAELANTREKYETGASSSKAVRDQLSKLSENLMLVAQLAIEMQSEVSGVMTSVSECSNCDNKPSNTGCPNCPMNLMSENSPLADMIWRSS